MAFEGLLKRQPGFWDYHDYFTKQKTKVYSCILKSETIKFIVEQRHVSPEQAGNILFENWNCPVAEVVNQVKGVYCMIPKVVDAPKPAALPKEDNSAFFVTYAKDPDLEKAMQQATLAMVNRMVAEKQLTPLDSYALASLAMDCRIGPHKAGDKEIHCMMPKSLWVKG